jgi:nitronate monooxygenase
MIFRPFRNTSRVFKNTVALEVNAIEKAKKESLVFDDIRELVSGARGRTVYETGDQDAVMLKRNSSKDDVYAHISSSS